MLASRVTKTVPKSRVRRAGGGGDGGGDGGGVNGGEAGGGGGDGGNGDADGGNDGGGSDGGGDAPRWLTRVGPGGGVGRWGGGTGMAVASH